MSRKVDRAIEKWVGSSDPAAIEDQLVLSYIIEGKSLDQLAKEIGVSKTSIHRTLKDWGISRRVRGRPRLGVVIPDKQLLGLTVAELAALYNVTEEAIRNEIKRRDLKDIRTPGHYPHSTS